jgi:hypothetical protein
VFSGWCLFDKKIEGDCDYDMMMKINNKKQERKKKRESYKYISVSLSLSLFFNNIIIYFVWQKRIKRKEN